MLFLCFFGAICGLGPITTLTLQSTGPAQKAAQAVISNVRYLMFLNYILVIICALANTGIFIYAGQTSSYKTPSWNQEQFNMLFYIVIVPAGLMLISAWGRKEQSKPLTWCAIMTLLSGVLFTAMYIYETDVSGILWLAPHFILTYAFAITSLFAAKNHGTH